jgi:hypothetical protein
MGNLAVLFLDQFVDVGSRYAQSILEMLVRNLEFLSSFWRRNTHIIIGAWIVQSVQLRAG